ncbi:MAG: aminotransferase class I/II-fold pyridoxal phosphate-dependent enzyme [Lachnospira sp.]
MENKDLLSILEDYCGGDYVPMHMPGAKRNASMFNMKNPYSLDLTEIEDFDNMHHADGIIADAFFRCAELFGADETLYLINGSSAGILSAICGSTKKNDTVIVARNCHISVYNAIYINELNPVYIYPMHDLSEITAQNAGICGRINPDDIKASFERNPHASAVIITSPTYEGLVSDIRKIADIVHSYGAVLIVDEAHGAHFNFHEAFPDSANKCGADVVVQSIHKTLPAFTQTALLHMNGSLADRQRIKKYWSIFQTTSPSYLLMASIDRCVSLIRSNGRQLFEAYVNRLLELRKKISGLKFIKLMDTDDISKIVLLADDGKELSNILRKKYHIELEMASMKYVIAMTSIGDKPEYYERFYDALLQIDIQLEKEKMLKRNEDDLELKRVEDCLKLEQVVSVYKAENMENEDVKLSEAAGRISAGKICFYPPGVPIINSGEQFNEKVIEEITDAVKSGIEVMGINYKEKEVMVRCLK